MNYKFHKDGTIPHSPEFSLLEQPVWVFGSNLAGIHGAGAAKVARELYGAQWGHGLGMTGHTYAIATKDDKIENLDFDFIEAQIGLFVEATKRCLQYEWFVTRVGCGLAGYKDEKIAPLFRGAVNCSFAEQWKRYLLP